MKTLAELHYRLTELATPQNEGDILELEYEGGDMLVTERDLLSDGWSKSRETLYFKKINDIMFRLKIIL